LLVAKFIQTSQAEGS